MRHLFEVKDDDRVTIRLVGEAQPHSGPEILEPLQLLPTLIKVRAHADRDNRKRSVRYKFLS